ncbi:hypothetical protein ALC57_15690 [Trachymyrmex cornetzi]|uniref:Endonuclease/exonuclease/phosphatase domain-containing protein n=1 Tax=Trachymyrmex cornetzi TaxID=471704 RepID=A0A151IWD9_9HYME|nr:hypothetical protein ALC57_15690 [Trachymyrmex cornetzi]
MDSKKNKEGNKLVEVIRERGWSILNGNVKGDEKGNWTYTGGKGNSVIDYVLVDEETKEGLESMEIGEEIDSDHHPLVVSLEGRGASRGVWVEGGREVFRERVGRLEWRDGGGNERIKEMGERIREILGSGGKEYRKQKREYKELCGNKKKQENERWERKVEGAKNEGQVWEIVNREMKKKGKRLEGWEGERGQYFRDRGVELGRRQGGELEGEIKLEELQEKDKEKQKEEKLEKIMVARYNRWYGWVKGEGIPAYLEKGWEGEEMEEGGEIQIGG